MTLLPLEWFRHLLSRNRRAASTRTASTRPQVGSTTYCRRQLQSVVLPRRLCIGNDNTIHVFYIGTDGHLHDDSRSHGLTWQDQIVPNSVAASPTATTISCHLDIRQFLHVVYISSNNLVDNDEGSHLLHNRGAIRPFQTRRARA